MKAFYIKSTLTKDLTRSFEDIIKESENNPESFIPETMEVDMGLEFIDIPERLTEKFKENFQDTKSILTEEEVMEFLEKNKKNMKQTAVEWLQSKLKNVEYNPLEKNGYSIAEERLFNQAKEMEKQQQGYSEEEVVELLQWLTDDNSIYSIMYGHKKYRFSTNDKDFTSKEILKQFKNK